MRALELAMAEWWWIVPVGLVLGAVSFWLTWRSLRRYSERPFPEVVRVETADGTILWTKPGSGDRD